MKKLLTFLMAGGKGERLYPLTKDRAKPAVPFGGIYRIIDFTLSNCINSGIRRIYVMRQGRIVERMDRAADRFIPKESYTRNLFKAGLENAVPKTRIEVE